MSRPSTDLPPGPDDDAWARRFFERMLAGRLEVAAFESAVNERWASGRFISRAPSCARWLASLALQQAGDAGYGRGTGVDFHSQWLVGQPGAPGAIHIQAPPEQRDSPRLEDKNRAPHLHDSGRVALITRGRAVWHVLGHDAGGKPCNLRCPVVEGDLLFWPAWTPHTFDAQEGFWLVSAMGEYVSPAADGFALDIGNRAPDLDALPVRRYGEHLAASASADASSAATS